MYESPTAKKEETFIQTSRRGGDREPGGFHIRVWINQEEQLGSETEQCRVPARGNKASKPLAVKTCGNWGEFFRETHRVLEWTQVHTPGNWHPKGPICLWEVGKVTESLLRGEQMALLPFGLLPHIQHHNTAMWVASPWQIPKSQPLRT